MAWFSLRRLNAQRVSSGFLRALATALVVAGALAVSPAPARDCGGTCSGQAQFTYRRPYVEPYSGTGGYWKVRCIKLVEAQGRHNLFTFLYRYGQPANDLIDVRIGTLEVGANWKDELLGGVREQWWNTDLYANEGHFYSVRLRDQPSETVYDIHTRHADIPGCGTFGHFVWEVIFDWYEEPRTPTPTSTPTPTNTPTATPIGADADGDEIPDDLESAQPAAGQTHWLLSDSDGDGLGDGVEDKNRNGGRDAGETDARDADTDDDQYLDGVEVNVFLSDPRSAVSPGALPDADGDLLPDFFDPNSVTPDADGDRYRDAYEAAHHADWAGNGAQSPGLGDVNKDGATSNVDALVVQSLFLRVIDQDNVVFGGDGFTRTDGNGDGQISNVDALVLQSFFLNVIPLLPL